MRKLFIILLLLVSSLFANIAKVTAIKGEVIIQRDSQKIFAKLGTIIEDKDSIKTNANARAQIIFKDNTIISLGKSSTFSIEDYLYEPKKPVVAKFKFGSGVFKTITGKIGKISPKKFKLTTKTSSIGIRGTIVGLESKNEVDTIIVPQGQVIVITPEGPIVVNAGQMVQSAVGVKPEVQSIPAATQEKMEQDSGASSNEQESGQGESTQTTALTQDEQEEAKEQQAAEDEEQKEEAKEEQKEESEEEQKEESEEESTEESQESEEEQSEESTEEQSEESTEEEQSEESESTNAQDEQSEESESTESTDNQGEEPPQDTDTDTTNEDVEAQEPQSVEAEQTQSVDEPDANVEVDEPDTDIDVEVETDVDVEIDTDVDIDVEVVIDEPDIQIDVPDVSDVVDDVVSDIADTVDDTTDDTTDDLIADTTTDDTTTDDTTTTTTTTDDTTTTTTTDPIDSYTASLSGYHIGAATGEPTTLAYNFNLHGDSSMTIAAGGVFNLGSYSLTKFYYPGSTTTEAISGSYTYTGFTIPASGAYTGHADITTIAFNRDIAGVSKALTYTIHADNTAEFIVGHTSNLNIEGTSDYYELFYTGVKATTATLSSSYVYGYKGYKSFGYSVDATTNVNNVIEETGHAGIQDLSTEIMYINPKTKSLSFVEPTHIFTGAYSYNAGYLDPTDGSITFKDIDFSDTTNTNIWNSGGGQIYGTEAQGLGAYGTQLQYTNYGLSAQTSVAADKGVFTYYYDSKTSITNTGSKTFDGYLSYLQAGSYIGNAAFSMSVDRDDGSISSTIVDSGYIHLNLSGTASALTSYYINDDLFGVMGVAGASSYPDSASTDDLIANKSFLVAVPDSYNGGSYANLDDESSWGYWTAEFATDALAASSYNIDPRSTWVAGIATAAASVASSPDATYNGHVLGAVSNGSNVYPILFDANNNVSLTFSFGSGSDSFSGTVAFNSSDPTNPNWSASVSGTGDNTIFSGSGSGTGAGSSIDSSSMTGKYYGTGEVKSVGGRFKFSSSGSGYDAFGVFKATK